MKPIPAGGSVTTTSTLARHLVAGLGLAQRLGARQDHVAVCRGYRALE
jgi:hypothetical protein